MEDIFDYIILNLYFFSFCPNLIPSFGCLVVNVTIIHPSFRLGFGAHSPLLPFSRSPSHPCLHAIGYCHWKRYISVTSLESVPCSPSLLSQFRPSQACSWTLNELVSPPPVLPFSSFLLHAIVQELFLNNSFDHEFLPTSQCSLLHSGQKQTP